VDDPYQVVQLGMGAAQLPYAEVTVVWLGANSMYPALRELTGRGVYGAARALSCKDEEVYIVGGANSAGRAAMCFSKYARKMVMLITATPWLKYVTMPDQSGATNHYEFTVHSHVVGEAGVKLAWKRLDR